MKIKLFLSLISFLVIIMCHPMKAVANDNDSIVTVVVRKQNPPEIPPKLDDDDEGRRLPSRPIYCVIDATSGISAPGINKEEIISFDVCDENSIVIASFTEEEDFISYIFSISGCFEIRLNMGAYYYGGFINL